MALLVSIPARSQQPQQAGAEPAQASNEQGQQQEPFRVISKVVVLPVSFLDAAGEFLDNIHDREITLTDNGNPQKIQTFELAYQPISMAILVDTSARLQGVIPNLRSSGILFTQLILGESGEAALITYDNTVDVRQEFTSDSDLIEKSFKALRVNGEGACLTDGISHAIEMLSARDSQRRRVIVVLAEGRDFGSEIHKNKVLRDAQLANIAIYTVELSAFKSLAKRPPPEATVETNDDIPEAAYGSEPGVPPGLYEGAGGLDLLSPLRESAGALRALWVHPMKRYAGGTGSDHINATSQKAVENAIQKIGHELHTQYWLSYVPNNLGTAEFHTIEVKVSRAGVKVRNRPGYFYAPMAVEPDQPPERRSREQ
jgi:VWFA-related protein